MQFNPMQTATCSLHLTKIMEKRGRRGCLESVGKGMQGGDCGERDEGGDWGKGCREGTVGKGMKEGTGEKG